jgi:RNase P protein component
MFPPHLVLRFNVTTSISNIGKKAVSRHLIRNKINKIGMEILKKYGKPNFDLVINANANAMLTSDTDLEHEIM